MFRRGVGPGWPEAARIKEDHVTEPQTGLILLALCQVQSFRLRFKKVIARVGKADGR